MLKGMCTHPTFTNFRVPGPGLGIHLPLRLNTMTEMTKRSAFNWDELEGLELSVAKSEGTDLSTLAQELELVDHSWILILIEGCLLLMWYKRPSPRNHYQVLVWCS